MDWETTHATAKSAFLSGRRFREQRLSPLKAQLSQFFLREVNSWSTWVDLPLTERLRNYRHGFLSHSAALYDFDSDGRSQYLSDIQREKTAYINDPQFVSVLANKIGFYLAMEPFDAHRPETFGVVTAGQFHPVNRSRQILTDGSPETADGPVTSLPPEAVPGESDSGQGGESHETVDTDNDETVDAGAWVLDRLDAGQQLVLKPVHGAGGDGVRHCLRRDGTYRMNGTEVSETTLRETVTDLDATVVMAFVEQATYAQELFPAATNTIRMITMYDSENEEVFCPIAVHRIGTERSAPVDNFDRTGISAEIDRETGELGTGIQLSAEGDVRKYDTHPSTGAQIAGQTVPGWERIFERVLDIAAAFSYVPYIGWDVVVTDDGEFVLLEANNCPGLKSLQAHRPLLTDDRTRRFYADHDVCT